MACDRKAGTTPRIAQMSIAAALPAAPVDDQFASPPWERAER
jgi:hypothetical protein